MQHIYNRLKSQISSTSNSSQVTTKNRVAPLCPCQQLKLQVKLKRLHDNNIKNSR